MENFERVMPCTCCKVNPVSDLGEVCKPCEATCDDYYAARAARSAAAGYPEQQPELPSGGDCKLCGEWTYNDDEICDACKRDYDPGMPDYIGEVDYTNDATCEDSITNCSCCNAPVSDGQIAGYFGPTPDPMMAICHDCSEVSGLAMAMENLDPKYQEQEMTFEACDRCKCVIPGDELFEQTETKALHCTDCIDDIREIDAIQKAFEEAQGY